MIFKSKLDLFNIFLYFLCATVFLLPAIVFNMGVVLTIVYMFLWALIVSLMGIIILKTNYTLKDKCIHIDNGFIGWDISYESITNLVRTKKLSSSSKTAVRCIEITYKNANREGEMIAYISPKEEENFIKEIKEKVSENVVFTNLRNREKQ